MKNECASFPRSAWLQEFQYQAQEAQMAYIKDPTLTWLPANWFEQVLAKLPSIPSDCDEECQTLADKAELRHDPSVLAQIIKQARSANGAVSSVIGVAGPLFGLPKTAALQELVIKRVMPPLFKLKVEFNRARPMHCCAQKLTGEKAPMFPPGHEYYPGHPSYPCGHGAVAMAMAHVLVALAPKQLKHNFIAAAIQVADNREIAGLHFPSDSAAGGLLGEFLAVELQKTTEFASLAPLVQAEWGWL